MPRRDQVMTAAAGLVAIAAAGGVNADPRPFTFVYEPQIMPQGEWEYEQWVTWKTDKDADDDFNEIDFRHEFEVGVNEKLQLGFYVSDWRYRTGNTVDDEFEWQNIAVEAIYNLTDPVADPIGLGLYGEVKFGDEVFELEGKLLAQKIVDRFNFGYNAIIEAEWEDHNYSEDKGEFAQTAGVSYELDPTLFIGAELLHEIEFPDWSEQEDDVVYLGPNVSYRKQDWWVTVTPMFQLTDIESEPNFQVRMIFGIFF